MRSFVATACVLALIVPALAAPQSAPTGVVLAAAGAAESHAPNPPRQLPVDAIPGASASGSATSSASATSTASSGSSTITETTTATVTATEIVTATSAVAPANGIVPPPVKRQATSEVTPPYTVGAGYQLNSAIMPTADVAVSRES